jgi:hypothetical protein
LLEAERVREWERMIDESVAEGRFLYSFSVFVTVGAKR